MQDKARGTAQSNSLQGKGLDVPREPILCYIRDTGIQGEFLKTFKDSLSSATERSAFPQVTASHLRDKTGAGGWTYRLVHCTDALPQPIFFPFPLPLSFSSFLLPLPVAGILRAEGWSREGGGSGVEGSFFRRWRYWGRI